MLPLLEQIGFRSRTLAFAEERAIVNDIAIVSLLMMIVIAYRLCCITCGLHQALRYRRIQLPATIAIENTMVSNNVLVAAAIECR